jgi:hypothetical protein
VRPSPAIRVLAGAALLAGVAGAILLLQRIPPPADAVAALADATLSNPADLTAGAPPSPQAAAALRRTVTALATAERRRAADINWAEARQWRAVTADGVRLTLQAVPAGPAGQAGPADGTVLVRLTADPLPGASAEAVARADAIRALRGRAYALPASDSGALVAR